MNDSTEPLFDIYAWADNPIANLTGADGLPIGSFPTDAWMH